ncbi:unnamed protein product [Didymodactylos carnosus]|uniref:Small RNA 2'-O-methyltransferase n=2 Tax=Didymodactylos carnosus TaxID=1234261 RepID=A0A8S2D5A8_9BILA|nr:unnamed protein product [Didymodactylos carnosus]CAF3601069.1 unnamed protein product [Didymodactylos carnosus]
MSCGNELQKDANILSDNSETKASHNSEDSQIKFDPPVSRQRYKYVIDQLSLDKTLSSIIDVGCGSCSLFQLMRYSSDHIQLFCGYDIMEFQLDEACNFLRPLTYEFIAPRRALPSHAFIVLGDATKSCSCFHNFDVVTLIEVIEHLLPEHLTLLVDHVFQHMRPKLIIATTPNADFNVLFRTMPYGKFRHSDHKFEFTQQEFQTWSNNIAQKYGYDVSFDGVGLAPTDNDAYYEQIGYCTQIAIFHSHAFFQKEKLNHIELRKRFATCTSHSHQLLRCIEYPFDEKLTKLNNGILASAERAKLLHSQIKYILSMYKLNTMTNLRNGVTLSNNSENNNSELLQLYDLDEIHDLVTVSIDSLLQHPRLIAQNCEKEEIIKIAMEEGYAIVNNYIVLCDEINQQDENYYDYSDNYDDDDNTIPQSNLTSDIIPTFAIEESWD